MIFVCYFSPSPFSTGWSFQNPLPNRLSVSSKRVHACVLPNVKRSAYSYALNMSIWMKLNNSQIVIKTTVVQACVLLQPSRRSPCVCVSSFTHQTLLLWERKSPGEPSALHWRPRPHLFSTQSQSQSYVFWGWVWKRVGLELVKTEVGVGVRVGKRLGWGWGKWSLGWN